MICTKFIHQNENLMKILLATLVFLVNCLYSWAQQKLAPGFNPKEYAELLSLAYYKSSIPDSVSRLTAKDPYKLIYQSPEVGLMNRWTLPPKPCSNG